jgi:hypothetical protein
MPRGLSTTETIRLKNKYNAYNVEKQTGGETPMTFDQWLDDNGYGSKKKGSSKEAKRKVRTSALS